MIKSIDTYYNGNYFRSRLEARWSIFFDNMRIPYQYEPQGFVTSKGCYLPDFYLPEKGIYAEVKPWIKFNESYNNWIKDHIDFERWVAFVKESSHPLLLLIGNPYCDYIPMITPERIKQYEDEDGGWLFDPVYLNGEITLKSEKEYFSHVEYCCKKANLKRFEML